VPKRVEDVVGDFIANAALYQRLDLKAYAKDAETSGPSLYDITPILRYCSHEKCKEERPFRRTVYQSGFRNEPGGTRYDGNITTIVYRCTHCESPFWCSIEVSDEEWMRKVGQLPPYDISIAPDLQNALGEDATLYKRAQICMSQSFGIAACSYLRRLLENQITPLLRLVYEASKEEGEDVGELSEILDEKVAENKIRLANRVLPRSLEVPGDNPLELIYDKLSAGLHRQSEQECMEIATEASQVLRYVIISINDEYERRKSKNRYVELIKGLRKRGG
jgi:hypothetical protein